jgi:carbonic anhydrase
VPHWSYKGETGPQYWGQLDPAYAACEKGGEQSPVQIESSSSDSEKKASDIKGQYRPVNVTLMKTGHAIQANLKAANNKIRMNGKEYYLLQFHFHSPSEHKINERQYPMELHFVHEDKQKKLAVLGVMIKKGKENAEISALLKSLEHDGKMTIDIKKLIPSKSKVFQYKGSLTTPPCTEGVMWGVLETPLELSQEQIQAFAEIYPNNNRPLQPLHMRKIRIGNFIKND